MSGQKWHPSLLRHCPLILYSLTFPIISFIDFIYHILHTGFLIESIFLSHSFAIPIHVIPKQSPAEGYNSTGSVIIVTRGPLPQHIYFNIVNKQFMVYDN